MNKTNYFENSEGVFKGIPRSWSQEILRQKRVITLGNHVWHLNHTSYDRYCNVSSVYYVSEDDTHLIRVSTHWSRSQVTRTKQVGWVASCWWELDSNKRNACGGFIGGIIPFNELARINN